MGQGLSFPVARPPVSYVLKEKYSTLGKKLLAVFISSFSFVVTNVPAGELKNTEDAGDDEEQGESIYDG